MQTLAIFFSYGIKNFELTWKISQEWEILYNFLDYLT